MTEKYVFFWESSRRAMKLLSIYDAMKRDFPFHSLTDSLLTMFFIDRVISPTHAVSREDILSLVLSLVKCPLKKTFERGWIKQSTIRRNVIRQPWKLLAEFWVLTMTLSSFQTHSHYGSEVHAKRREEGWWKWFSSLSLVGRLFSCVLVAENVTVLVSTLFSPLQIQYSS